MEILIHNTDKVVELNGIPVRIWEGKTAAGIEVIAYISLLQVAELEDCSEFERELKEMAAPSPRVQAIPLRLLI